MMIGAIFDSENSQDKLRFIIIFAAVFTFFEGFAQSSTASVDYPVRFDQFSRSYPLLSAARGGAQGKYEVSIGYNGFSGLNENLRTMYAHGSICFGEQSSSRHCIYGTFIGDKEGVYINRSRAYAGYSYHRMLTTRWTLSGGANGGLVSHNVEGNIAVSGASASTVDANIGALAHSRWEYIGAGLNQFTNSKIAPYLQTVSLRSFWTFMGGKHIEIGEKGSLGVDVLWLATGGIDNRLYVQMTGRFMKYGRASLVWHHQRSLMLSLGLEDIEIAGVKTYLFLSTRAPLTRYVIDSSSKVELGLGIKLLDPEAEVTFW